MEDFSDNENIKRKLRKITCKWDERNTKKLIKCVKNHRVLWDATHQNYKTKAIRECKWKIIGVEIFCNENSSVEVCIKWQNLRSQYKNYSKKYKYGSNNNQNIRWKYFNMLQFLSSSSPTDICRSPQSIIGFDTTTMASDLNIPSDEEKYPSTQENYNLYVDSISSNNNKTIDNTTSTTPIASINNNMNKLQELPDSDCKLSCNNNILITDEYSDFGKFVANELRNLKLAGDLQSKLRRQIQRYIVDIADEYAIRLISTTNLQDKKPDSLSTSSATVLSTSSVVTTSSAVNDYFTEYEIKIED